MTQSGKHGIFDGMSWNMLKMRTTNFKFLETSPNSLKVIVVKFEDHRSDASHKIWKTRNIPRNFFESPKTDYKLFQMVKLYPSMWRRIFGHYLGNTESSAEHSA